MAVSRAQTLLWNSNAEVAGGLMGSGIEGGATKPTIACQIVKNIAHAAKHRTAAYRRQNKLDLYSTTCRGVS